MKGFELPDFSVLVGRNGVGKTQLLDAIATGHATVSNVQKSKIERYDMNTFQVNESGSAGWRNSSFAEITVESYFSSAYGNSLADDSKEIFAAVRDGYGFKEGADDFREFENTIRTKIRSIPEFSVIKPFSGTEAVSEYFQRLASEVLAPLAPPEKNTRRNKRKGSEVEVKKQSCENNSATLICLAMKLSGKLPHELVRQDVLRAAHYEGKTIGNQISQIFTRYKVEQYAWAHAEGDAGRGNIRDLKNEYEQVHPPPWLTLNRVIAQMREASHDLRLFDFKFSDPSNDNINFIDHSGYSFNTNFTNLTTGVSYSLNDLSSGEKILMALCLASFNQSLGRRQPSLVLLDELDSVLHPSMISALITGLKNLFISNEIPVIMATHSVTTVSLLDEGEIFRVARSSGNMLDVRPVTRAEAVAELSEGLATIEAGLKIATSESTAPITILTEGKNALHLKKWASLFFKNEIKVFDKLQHRTGKNELASYGRLLASMETNSHFLIVWDCDANEEADKLSKEFPNSKNVTAFAFVQRENMLAPKGIENNYDEKYLKQYTTTSRRNTTGEQFISMNDRDKADFADHVHEQGTKDYFHHFDDLEKVVQEILSGQQPASRF